MPEDRQKKFRSIVGLLMYLSSDRPDCQYATKELSRRLNKATEVDEGACKRMCRYIVGTSSFGIKYEGPATGILNGIEVARLRSSATRTGQDVSALASRLREVCCSAALTSLPVGAGPNRTLPFPVGRRSSMLFALGALRVCLLCP